MHRDSPMTIDAVVVGKFNGAQRVEVVCGACDSTHVHLVREQYEARQPPCNAPPYRVRVLAKVKAKNESANRRLLDLSDKRIVKTRQRFEPTGLFMESTSTPATAAAIAEAAAQNRADFNEFLGGIVAFAEAINAR